METPFLLLLERAELAAADDRQAARAEGDRRVERARMAARAVEDAAPEIIAAAVAARTRRIHEEALSDVAAIERLLSALDEEAPGDEAPPGDTAVRPARLDRAVALVVAAVLAEGQGP